jgi:hypothetical protein
MANPIQHPSSLSGLMKETPQMLYHYICQNEHFFLPTIVFHFFNKKFAKVLDYFFPSANFTIFFFWKEFPNF